MAYHPLNLFFRFILELLVWFCMGLFGFYIAGDGFRYFYMIFIPLVSMFIWGTFNVPGDRSRSGKAPIVVRGWTRLIIEFLTFIFGAWTLNYLNYSRYGIAFLILIILHYLFSLDRVKWLLKN